MSTLKFTLSSALIFICSISFAQLPVTSGNVLWLKADAGVYIDAGVTAATNGQAVQQWNDQSGLGNNVTQLTLANKPEFQTAQIGGQPSLYFDGAVAAKYLNNTTQNLVTAGAARTTFIVSKINAASTGATLFTYRRSTLLNSLSLGQNAGVTYVYSDGANASTNTSVANAVIDIAKKPFIASWNSTSGNKMGFRFNSVDQLLNQSGTVTTESGTAGFTVGGREDYASWWQGLISEVIVYNRNLTLAETQQVESYLQTKYGISCGGNATTKPGSGNAAFYPGTGSYGSYTPDSEDWNWGSGDFGIECWLNPGGGGTDNCIMTQSVGGASVPGTSSFYFSFNNGGSGFMSLGLYTTTGTGWTNNIYTATNVLVQSKWQHVAVTRKAGVTKIYVDGIAQATTGTVAATIPNGSQPLEIGMQNFTPALGGQIDEVRIYKGAAPDQTTIKDWMCKKTTPSHPYYANMVANYNFDENVGSSFAADKINCHNMYFLGSTSLQKSAAAIGDISSYQYATNNATANINFGSPTDNLSATMNAGTSEAVHVYGVNELPSSAGYPGITGNDKYAGVYVVKGNASAAYTATYNYTNNTTVTPSIETNLKLFKRTDNAATIWNQATPQTLNTGTKTITATAQNAATNVGQNNEYVLGSAVTAVTAVPPTCYGTFNSPTDLLSPSFVTLYAPTGDNAIPTQVVDNFTYEVWVKPTAPLAYNSVGDTYVIYPVQPQQIGLTGYGIGLAAGTDGIRVYALTAGSNTAVVSYSGTFTNWTHIAVVLQNQIPILYINGLAVASGSTLGTCRATASYLTSNGCNFKGSTTDFRLWNYARTGAQINSNMNAVPAGSSAGLVASYTFPNMYNGAGNLVKSNATNFPSFKTDLMTTGSVTTPSFTCTGQNFPTLTAPTCAIQFDGQSRMDIGNMGPFLAKGTIEGWIMPSPAVGQQSIFSSTPDGSMSNGIRVYVNTTTPAQLGIVIGTEYGTVSNLLSQASINSNAYNHVVVSWDTINKTIKGYVNGKLIINTTNNFWPNTMPNCKIGNASPINTWGVVGKIDEVRYWNVERTQTEIIANASSITGTEAGLQAYYNFNDNVIGGTLQPVLNKCVATSGTLNGTTKSGFPPNGFPKFPCSFNPPTCGIKLNGVNDYVQMPFNAALSLSQFTIAAWVKTTVSKAGYQTIICKQYNASSANYQLAINNNRATVTYVSATGSVTKVVANNYDINDGIWHYLAGTYDGATLKIYVDGALENTLATTSVPDNSTLPFSLGSFSGGTANFFNGNMDEASVWNTAKTAADVLIMMNNPLIGNEANLVAYYNFNDNNRSGQYRTVTNLCNTTGSSINGKTFGSSLTPVFECAPPPFTTPECNMQLNGTTDYAQAANTADISLTQFSVGAYFKTTVAGTAKAILMKDVDGINHNYQLSLTATNKAMISFTNTASAIVSATGTTTVTDGNWHYAVGTYDGANLKIYVDGVLEATTANATTPMTGTNALNIGVGNGGLNKYNGSIDELSVWNTALPLAQVQSFIGQRLVGNETNLVAYYNFAGNSKNGQGVTIVNSCTTSGVALNATTAGTTTTPIFTCSEILPNPPTCSLLLNGLNDGANVNVASGIGYPTITQNFTMEVLAKPLLPKNGSGFGPLRTLPLGHYIENGVAGQRYVIGPDQAGDGFAAGHAGVGIALGTNGVSVYEHSSSYLPGRINLNSLTIDDWVHLSVVSENGILKLYVNGALSGTAPASGYILHPSANISNYYGNFAGYVGEVRVWNVAKTSDQIRLGINTNLVGNEANLVSLYKFGNNTINGDSKLITALGSNATGLKTYGTLNSPIFTCSNDVTIKRDTLVGSGKMLALNGTTTFAELGNLGNIPVQGSLMTWFNATTIKEKGMVFSTTHFRNRKGRNKSFNLFTRADGRLQLTFGTDTTATGFQDTVTVANNINVNKWYHFAMTWDTAAKTYTAYVNGIQTATGTSNFWPTQFESFKAGIGIAQDAAYVWNGYVDEISEWNKILSLTEIRNQLASKINSTQPNYNNVLHYYRFDNNGNNGNTINDYKGTAHGAFYSADLGCIFFSTTLSYDCYYGSNNYPFGTSSAPIGSYSSYQYAANSATSSLQIGNGQGGTDNVSATLNAGTSDGIHVYGEDTWPNTVNGVVDTLAGSKRYAGVFVVNPNAAAYDFVYDYTNNQYVTNDNRPYLKLKKRDNNAVGGWLAPSNMSLNQTANTLTCTGQNTEYILEKSSTVLAAKLLSFTAALNNNKQTELIWKVTNEINVKNYEIEWSTDGQNWQTQITLNYDAAFNGIYKAFHVKPTMGNNYYRIKQNDVGGTFTKSIIQLVKLLDKISISVYPNPSSEIVNIVGWNNIKQMQLFDISNRKIKQWQESVSTINVQTIPNGTYILKAQLKTGEDVEQKIIVQH